MVDEGLSEVTVEGMCVGCGSGERSSKFVSEGQGES